MRPRGHKRKNSHVVIVTSDAVDVNMRQFRIRPWVVQAFVLLLSVFVGALIGFFVFEKDMWDTQNVADTQNEDTIAQLEEENASLLSQIADLTATVQILSETVTQKTESESRLTEQLDLQYAPTEFPLTGFANMEESGEGDPICVFTGTSGAMVVATASGTVAAVNDDGEYGHNVWLDHGNGYITIYRNQGDAKVKQGETVTRGSTLFLVGDDNIKLGYQMMKDGVYIDPMDMLDISG